MSSARASAQVQRSSNLFGVPDDKKEHAQRQRKELYRQELEQQMNDNVHSRVETSRNNKDHPLETRVERYAITMRKQEEVEEEPDGEFEIGRQGKTSSDIQKEKQAYQDILNVDMRNKKIYLEHKEENDLKNRKPVQRSTSPVCDGEFNIGGDAVENERERRENARAFAQGNAPARSQDKKLGEEDHSGFFVGTDQNIQLSKKDRKKQQYKRELDEQVDLFTKNKQADEARVQDQDRYNARQNLPYSGNSQADVKRKEAIEKRQVFIQEASQNFPTQKRRPSNLDAKATFAIGADNNKSSDVAQKKTNYKNALDEQMELRTRRVEEEKESLRRQDAQYAAQKLPYLGNHDDE